MGLMAAHVHAHHARISMHAHLDCLEPSITNGMSFSGDQASEVVAMAVDGPSMKYYDRRKVVDDAVHEVTTRGKKKTTTRIKGPEPWARRLRQRLLE